MTSYLACLSLLELEELRLGMENPDAQRHLAGCQRCTTLLAQVRAAHPSDDAEMPDVELPGGGHAVGRARRELAETSRVRTGTLWRAASGPDSHVAWVVGIVGRSPDGSGALLVVPVAGEPEWATEKDLLLDRAVLGYPAFLDMTNLGSLLREQLLEPVAELERPVAEGMVAMYRHLLAGSPAPLEVSRGIAAIDETDPRLLEQAARAEVLQELWRPAHELVQDVEEERAEEGAPEPATVVVLSEVLGRRLEGQAAAWDRTSLLEASRADGARLDAFLVDRLDITDKRDVPDLARVLHVLDIPWDEAEPAVRGSLARSPGGSRRADGPELRMAARSQPGADTERTTDDLFADRTAVDASEEARNREAASYLAELERILDGLDLSA